jgi:uncharacterized protein YggE
MKPPYALQRVQTAAARLERAERNEEAARILLAARMQAARDAGATLKQVAEAAGVTLQRVHQIVGNRPPPP